MIKGLRKKENLKRIFLLLAILIIPSFILWGFGGIFTKRDRPNYAGKIFGRKVPFSIYESALLACRIRAQILLGDEFFKIQRYLNLEGQAWEWLILKEELKRRNIKVDDKEVIREISENPLFQRKGKFDKNLYLNTLNYLRISPKDFEEQIRCQIGFRRLFEDLTKGVSLNEEEIKQVYKKEHQEDFSEEKFLEEKEEFSKRLIQDRKRETFNQFLEKLKAEANLEDNIKKIKISQ